MSKATYYSNGSVEVKEELYEKNYQEKRVMNKPINHKKQIEFRNPSFIRRNIDKALVRSLAKSMLEIEMEIKEEFKKWGIPESVYTSIAHDVKTVNALEKNANYKKDYARTINHMMESFPRQIVFRKCLEKKKQDLDAANSQRVRGKNIEIYCDTLEDIIKYLSNLNKSN
jgi:hypothetical protein